MTPEDIEIYQQRYETFRHLDRLKWQMLQLVVAIASATALVLRLTTGEVGWWFCLILGIPLSLIGLTMMRIGDGIRANAKTLRAISDRIGDHDQPDVSNKWRSVGHWIAVLILAVGFFLSFCPLVYLFLSGGEYHD